MKKYISLLLVVFCCSISMQAQVVMPHIFTDNMVLQRNVLIPVWGWAKPGEKVEVRFNSQVKITKADKSGKWTVKLDAEKAGGPFELSVKAKNTVLFKNVLVGEVWLCSGQSNMEFTVKQSNNAINEIASATNPYIRHIKIARVISSEPKSDFASNSWTVCDSSTVGDFSAVGYFFAKNICNELKIPVGLINSSWGGTNIETWISREGFESCDEFKEMIAAMPKVNLDTLSRMKSVTLAKRIESIQGSKLNSSSMSSFKEMAFDDSRWPELNQPQLWEEQSLGEFDGTVWLRKSIILTSEDSKKSAILELSKVDDEDITYVNGVKVGSNTVWDAKRKYIIPAGLLREGKNTIAVRVVDNGGGGGIYGDPTDFKLTLESKIIPLTGNWKFQVEAIKFQVDVNSYPSLAYNAMINPMLPYAFQGALWYQGESNAGRAFQYRKAFPLMINDWRQKWNQGNFPFYFVQLATFYAGGNSNEGCAWAELREAQSQTLNVPRTGMCVTTDLVADPKDIHPTNKQDVGKRLAAMALNDVYEKEMICSGPSYKSMEIKGDQVIISFSSIGGGLISGDKYGYLKGFEVAGNDHVFYLAKAFIKNNTVVLFSDKVENPVAVHFGWIGDATDNNLFNNEGFPAVPFRTDDWKTITKEAKYKIADL